MSQNFGLGSLDLPGEWRTSSQVELVEAQPGAAGAASIVIRRTVTKAASAEEAIGSIIEELQAGFRGIYADTAKPLKFDDGAAGMSVVTRLPLGPGVAALQLHTVRVDRGSLTHIAVTIEEKHGARLGSLGKIAASYRP